MFSINKEDFIEMKTAITREDYNNLKELEAVCVKDNINLKLELEYKLSQLSHTTEAQALTEKAFRSSCMKEYLYYSQGRPVSYLGICSFGGNVYELNGMTHPDFRRRGFFRRLYTHAMSECRFTDRKSLLLLSDGNSLSGIGFIEAVGGQPSFSEYRMELPAAAYKPQTDEKGPGALALRTATSDDLAEIRKQDHIFFGDEEDKGDSDFISSIDHTFIVENEDKIIGKIKIDFNTDEAFIYGFGILPEFRGAGYGKAAIHEALHLIFSKGLKKAALDVAAVNDRALHVYTSNGFVKVSEMRYYEKAL
ncbi:GNAT family N-acetyltransferase [Anaerocolumna sp. AGMB13020]|uniref:GNAT family N-acetyltransferase n=1 Tax=Anaerocolumna sp. AGMB13020 TaxID=3081750 RepID=UPI002952F839|nr:GNAT family N-acetyltransferase [Anaerocolumna sp. AGMB13020]WOO38848.1 GNAT family N-acetyltransferase [Anaerocolumna sp. AGMB13020]